MKLQTFGTPPQEGRGQMLISNHISWLDIMAVNGAFPGRFVAKDDVAKWPVVGYLATQRKRFTFRATAASKVIPPKLQA